MTTTMDIAVCLDCSRSISFYSNPIRRIVLSILRKALRHDENGIRMALVEFQSHTDDWVTQVHPFTSIISTFQGWIDTFQTNGENLNQCKAIADALNECLTLDWRSNDKTDRSHEKLVILITDGAPCNFQQDECPWTRYDLWRVANEFERQNITLVVVGIEPSVVICDDFYCGLANKTGGEYIPLVNACRILSFAVETAIMEEDTLSQVFRHIDIDDIERDSLYHYKYVEKRARFMIENCRTMSDIWKWLYNYRNQPIQQGVGVIFIDDDDDDAFDNHTPPNTYQIDRFFSNPTIFRSTPITEDEGYRTRLPTTASADSSFVCIDGRYSPVIFHPPKKSNRNSSSEIDHNSV